MIKSGKVSPLKWGYVLLHGVLVSCSTATKKFNRKHWRIHQRLLTVLKTSNKSVWSNVSWYVKVCIFWKCIRYTIHWDKTQLLKKFPLGKISGAKIPSFSSRAPSHHCFSFNLWFLHELKHKVRLSKTVCGIFHFRFRFAFIKVYIFVQQKTCTLWL